jgi:hypothetical protein
VQSVAALGLYSDMREILEQIQDDCAQRFGKGEHSTAAPYSRTLYVRVVLIFLIAGLLYLLRFERVDNLGAYRISPEYRLFSLENGFRGGGLSRFNRL